MKTQDSRQFPLRQMILALVFLGIVGLLIELLLLEHFDSITQWIPLVSLGLGLATSVAVARRPTRSSIRSSAATR